MSNGNTPTCADELNQALLQRYRELELRVTTFSVVEQQLVAARDRLDREMVVHARMHRFNASALLEMPSTSLVNLVAESLVDIFEVEVGVCYVWPGSEEAPPLFAAVGMAAKPSGADAIFNSIVAALTPEQGRRCCVLSPKQLEQISLFVELREAYAVVIRDNTLKPFLAILAGNTPQGGRFYEAVSRDRCDIVALLAQHAAAHFTNHRSRQTIRAQVEQITRSEERLRRLGDNLPGGAVYELVLNSRGEGRFGHLSAGIELIHGLPLSTLVAQPRQLFDQILPEDRPLFISRARTALRTGGPFSAEVRIKNTAGDVRWVSINAAWTETSDGAYRWDGMEMDVTERKRLEERLTHSQKVESIGHLAGGIAHEFNNLLAAIVLNIGLAQEGPIPPGTQGILTDVDSFCKRGADLVRQLLAFSRQSVMQAVPLDLETVVATECKMLARLLGERVSIDFSSAANLSQVKADRNMIAQVLLNLCINARDAMNREGCVRIRLEQAIITERQALEHVEVIPGHYIRMSVRDDGCGMTDALKARLFEPFFTTKEVGHGTGLGLATVRGIVHQHRGWIAVESAPGKGATFHVYWPAFSMDHTTDQAPGPASLTQELRPLLLLVEDESSVQKVAIRFLERLGCEVLSASSALEALPLWQEHRGQIDLLFTDVVMPGEMSGVELAERIMADRPELPVILTSGYSVEIFEAFKAEHPQLTVLPKPYTPTELRRAVLACLASKAPAGYHQANRPHAEPATPVATPAQAGSNQPPPARS